MPVVGSALGESPPGKPRILFKTSSSALSLLLLSSFDPAVGFDTETGIVGLGVVVIDGDELTILPLRDDSPDEFIADGLPAAGKAITGCGTVGTV